MRENCLTFSAINLALSLVFFCRCIVRGLLNSCGLYNEKKKNRSLNVNSMSNYTEGNYHNEEIKKIYFLE